jgi:hypothetical protein
MCPFCTDKPCKIIEQPSGKVMCECGRHSWPNSAAFTESVRKANLTIGGAIHTWTQSL